VPLKAIGSLICQQECFLAFPWSELHEIRYCGRCPRALRKLSPCEVLLTELLEQNALHNGVQYGGLCLRLSDSRFSSSSIAPMGVEVSNFPRAVFRFVPPSDMCIWRTDLCYSSYGSWNNVYSEVLQFSDNSFYNFYAIIQGTANLQQPHPSGAADIGRFKS
jgi:hypothetical protein